MVIYKNTNKWIIKFVKYAIKKLSKKCVYNLINIHKAALQFNLLDDQVYLDALDEVNKYTIDLDRDNYTIGDYEFK